MPRQNKKHQGDDQSPLPVPPKKTQQITSEKYSPKSYASSPELDYVEEPKANTRVRAGKKRAREEEEFGPSGDFGSEMQKMLEVFGADKSKTNSEKKKRLELLTQAAMKSTAKKVEQIWKGQQNERSKMQKMLEVLGADISKTNSEKKKRVELLIQAAMKSTAKKLEQIWKGEQNERTKLQEKYCRQVESLISQWNVHFEKMKEQEEKLNNVFQQQHKVLQQAGVIHGQCLKTIRQLKEQFVRGLDELEKNHVDQRNSMQSELKKE